MKNIIILCVAFMLGACGVGNQFQVVKSEAPYVGAPMKIVEARLVRRGWKISKSNKEYVETTWRRIYLYPDLPYAAKEVQSRIMLQSKIL
jgi:hypothetical protein